MGNWMHEAEKSHNKRVFAGYEEYKQRVKDLRVTPLVLPYDVQQEVFGLDEKGTRYPVYPSDHFDVTPGFSHPASHTRLLTPGFSHPASHTRNYKTRGLASSGTRTAYTPGVW
nr:MAG TPA: hypothetical protein [Caudoviricetes sp.]